MVLTGGLDDGAAGARAVHRAGESVIVQDPETCVAPSMPENALRAVPSAAVVRLEQIGDAIARSVQTSQEGHSTVTSNRALELETRIAMNGRTSPGELDTIGRRSTLTCPDCSGVVWWIGDDAPLRYRCHTGHAFSGEALNEAQASGLEDSLWTSIRMAQEHAALLGSRAERAQLDGSLDKAQTLKQEQARLETLQQALRALIKER